MGRPSTSTLDRSHAFGNAPLTARILIGDDDESALLTYAICLRAAHFSVLTAATPRECVSRLRHDPVDLLLLDFRFGTADGITILRRLRSAGLRIPIIIMTKYADLRTATRAFRSGATDFVDQPLLDEDLIALVARHLAALSTFDCRSGASNYPAGLRAVLAELRHLGFRLTFDQPELEPAQERYRLQCVAARACADEYLTIDEFRAMVAATRWLSLEGPRALLRQVIPEVRAILSAPMIEQAGQWRPPVRELLSGLARREVAVLARSEAEWGAILCIHPAHLGRLVYADTGYRFTDWRRMYRFKEAVRLLATTQEQASQIAFAVGFEHTQTSQFNREFRMVFGMTPIAFRAACAVDELPL